MTRIIVIEIGYKYFLILSYINNDQECFTISGHIFCPPCQMNRTHLIGWLRLTATLDIKYIPTYSYNNVVEYILLQGII